MTSGLKCLYCLLIGQAVNCTSSLAVFAIGFLINVNFQCLDWKQKTKPVGCKGSSTPLSPPPPTPAPMLCRIFACLPVKRDGANTLTPRHSARWWTEPVETHGTSGWNTETSCFGFPLSPVPRNNLWPSVRILACRAKLLVMLSIFLLYHHFYCWRCYKANGLEIMKKKKGKESILKEKISKKVCHFPVFIKALNGFYNWMVIYSFNN